MRAHPHYPRTLPLCHLLSLGGSRRIFLNFFVRLLLFLQAASKCVYTHSTTFCGYPRTHTRFLHVLPARWRAIYNATPFLRESVFLLFFGSNGFLLATHSRLRFAATYTSTALEQTHPPVQHVRQSVQSSVAKCIFSSCPGINFFENRFF